MRYHLYCDKGENMKKFVISLLLLAGCNSVYMTPHSLDASKTVYATRGGYGMRRAIKEQMEMRGYDVKIGKIKSSYDFVESDSFDGEVSYIPKDATYVLKVAERREAFWPVWCVFNGFWWWNFNVSIVNQQTNKEILAWRGRGCANSSLRKLNSILDEMEK